MSVHTCPVILLLSATLRYSSAFRLLSSHHKAFSPTPFECCRSTDWTSREEAGVVRERGGEGFGGGRGRGGRARGGVEQYEVFSEMRS